MKDRAYCWYANGKLTNLDTMYMYYIVASLIISEWEFVRRQTH